MRWNLAVVVLIAALLAVPVVAAEADDSSYGNEIVSFNEDGTGIIKGTIRSANGDNPVLNGAKVTLFIDGEQFGEPTYTQKSGNYEFDDVPTDGAEYKLKIMKKGFVSTEITLASAPKEDEPLIMPPINLKPSNEEDSAHLMMFIGAGCSLLLIVLATVQIIRKK